MRTGPQRSRRAAGHTQGKEQLDECMGSQVASDKSEAMRRGCCPAPGLTVTVGPPKWSTSMCFVLCGLFKPLVRSIRH